MGTMKHCLVYRRTDDKCQETFADSEDSAVVNVTNFGETFEHNEDDLYVIEIDKMSKFKLVKNPKYKKAGR